METIAKIRRRHEVNGETISEIARRFNLSRNTARRLFEDLQGAGYAGAYDSVQRFVKRWKQTRPALTQAFVPLVFPAGDAAQFDWSHEQVELGGVVQTIKLAHFRLAHSR
ncbi:helix-turn-helix domain-containing protein [Thiolapillus sp.]|uniref:helix-turn-helix domain-containing protein n=3 Tax=Thiolapillus sp. TaxID=2017437 RepID=UPI0025D14825|nr:helix-turn-helix domain-containing protein [Thiolapillus sp.]